MKQSKSYQSDSSAGFTLVELLIVVVIIAILASISTVAYTNIQDRANAAKTIAVVRQYAEIFDLYKLEEGHYPYPPSGANNMTVCLGPPDAYPADDTFEAGQCANWSSGSASHFVREDFNDLVSPITSEILRGDTQTISITRSDPGWSGTENYRGVMYYDTNMGENGFIHYFLKGTQTCIKGDTYHYDGATECILSLDGSATDDKWGKHGGEGWWL